MFDVDDHEVCSSFRLVVWVLGKRQADVLFVHRPEALGFFACVRGCPDFVVHWFTVVYGAFVSFLVVFGRKKDTDVAISVGYVCFELLTYLNLTS